MLHDIRLEIIILLPLLQKLHDRNPKQNNRRGLPKVPLILVLHFPLELSLVRYAQCKRHVQMQRELEIRQNQDPASQPDAAKDTKQENNNEPAGGCPDVGLICTRVGGCDACNQVCVVASTRRGIRSPFVETDTKQNGKCDV